MTEKVTTYWRVRSGNGADAKPEWTQLDGPQGSKDGLVGELRVEDDDQVMLVYFEDEAARDRVVRASRDAAALAREWEIPRQAARDPRE